MKKVILFAFATIVFSIVANAKDILTITNGNPSLLLEKGKKAVLYIDWSRAVVVKYNSNEDKVTENIGVFWNYMQQKGVNALENTVIKQKLQEEHYGRDEFLKLQIKHQQQKIFGQKSDEGDNVLWEPTEEEIIARKMIYCSFINACQYNHEHKKFLNILMQKDTISLMTEPTIVKEMEKMNCLYDKIEDVNNYYTIKIQIDTIDLGTSGGAIAFGTQGAAKKAGGAIIRGTMTCTEKVSGNIILQANIDRVKGVGGLADVDRIHNVIIAVLEDLFDMAKKDKRK